MSARVFFMFSIHLSGIHQHWGDARALGRAMVAQTRVGLKDEPLSKLDARLRHVGVDFATQASDHQPFWLELAA